VPYYLGSIGAIAFGGSIASIGIGFCFIFNALSFVAVIIALFLMKKDELHKVSMVKRKRTISGRV